jgi:hypothetical protein
VGCVQGRKCWAVRSFRGDERGQDKQRSWRLRLLGSVEAVRKHIIFITVSDVYCRILKPPLRFTGWERCECVDKEPRFVCYIIPLVIRNQRKKHLKEDMLERVSCLSEFQTDSTFVHLRPSVPGTLTPRNTSTGQVFLPSSISSFRFFCG